MQIFHLFLCHYRLQQITISLKNAIFYQEKILAFLIEEKDLNDKLYYLIKEIHKNNSILNKIIQNQKQYSDKNVYINIDKNLKKIINEKN